MHATSWPKPSSRDVGAFSDLSLYVEALQLAEEQGVLTVPVLKRKLAPRLRGLLPVPEQSQRVAEQLLAELRRFQWLQADGSSQQASSSVPCRLTPEGKATLELARQSLDQFRRRLATCLHRI